MQTTHNFDTNYQTALIGFLLSDAQSFSRCRNILKEEYFAAGLVPSVRFILGYADEHSKLPIPEQVAAVTGHQFSLVANPIEREAWLLNETEQFCRYRAIENVILNGTDMLAKGMHADIERQIKEAMTISLITDLGDDYFRSTKERLARLKNRDNMVSTGWRVIDNKLYGGYTKGSLNIFAGGSGSGKSLFLQNQGLNWALVGMNVIYITLELSQDLVGSRIDSMVTGMSTKDIFRNSDDVCFKIEHLRQAAKPGSFHLKKMAEAGTTCNDIRAYLKEYTIKTGHKPDALLIDYLDLVYPNNSRIDVTNAFAKDKYVSEEMRAIGGEWDIPVVSASQLNRQSVEAQEFDHSHIAGGISKINTADNVFGIFTSESMREAGRYRLQFLKTRSSSAVGSKVELAYDPTCMRISDPADLDDRSDDEVKASQTIDRSTAATASQAAHTPAPAAPMRQELQDLFSKLRK
jgi:KaiC/GvpD/RAD55 family RecA-like ATPase